MLIYNFDATTGEYLGAADARRNPEFQDGMPADEEFFLPAFATLIAPPAIAAGQAAIFVAGAWSTTPDHRGETWYAGRGNPVVVTTLGTPDGLTAVEPAAPPASPPTKDQLAAYAAAVRYNKEVAGVPWRDGLVIQTDRESQSKMLSEFVAIGAGLRPEPSPWKFADNKFANLSNADMSAVCLAGRAHVADAFASEDTVQAEIAAGTFTTFSQIDTAFQ